MKNDFKMSDLRSLAYFLRMEILNIDNGNFLHEKIYVEDILKKFKMSSCNSIITLMDTDIKLKKDTND